MTLDQRHVAGIVVRAVGLALLAGILLALEWAWRTHAWNDLKAVDGRCVLVGARVDDGRVPTVGCMRMVPGTSKMLLSLHRSVPRD